MAEDNFTLSTFYASWKEYQDRMRSSVAPLTAEQLALRAAPGLRSVGENAKHIIGCRLGWYGQTMGQQGSEALKRYDSWDESNPASLTGADLAQGLDDSWQFMTECLTRWTPAQMEDIVPDEWDGKVVQLSRAWIVWHVIEHDLHHGGEISITLGMHGVPADFPG